MCAVYWNGVHHFNGGFLFSDRWWSLLSPHHSSPLLFLSPSSFVFHKKLTAEFRRCRSQMGAVPVSRREAFASCSCPMCYDFLCSETSSRVQRIFFPHRSLALGLPEGAARVSRKVASASCSRPVCCDFRCSGDVSQREFATEFRRSGPPQRGRPECHEE